MIEPLDSRRSRLSSQPSGKQLLQGRSGLRPTPAPEGKAAKKDELELETCPVKFPPAVNASR